MRARIFFCVVFFPGVFSEFSSGFLYGGCFCVFAVSLGSGLFLCVIYLCCVLIVFLDSLWLVIGEYPRLIDWNRF